MKVPEKFYCDICKCELGELDYKQKKVPVITNCEWTEGRSCKPYVENVTIDICHKCYAKSVGIECDFRGENIRLRQEQKNAVEG